jgi:hypothetical protein
MKHLILAALLMSVASFAQASKTPALDLVEGKGLLNFAVNITDVTLRTNGRGGFSISASNPFFFAGMEAGMTNCELEVTLLHSEVYGHLQTTLVYDKLTSYSGLVLDDNKIFLSDRESTNITPLVNAIGAATRKLTEGSALVSFEAGLKKNSATPQTERQAAKLLSALGNGDLEKGLGVLKSFEKLCSSKESRF